jgi:deoxyribose-phosphate aldolase
MMTDAAFARRALALLDLTDLSAGATEAGIVALCAKAALPEGHVAAVCVWPQFVGIARRVLKGNDVKIATVVNFPAGGTHVGRITSDVAEALSDGADEIDLVMPWKAFLEGDTEIAAEMIGEVKAACEGKMLKVILESGAFPDQASLQRACELAITAGADFLKTSTGKIEISATPEAAQTILETIKASSRPIGFKASGGIRTLAEARIYLEQADKIMGPRWATPKTFRFGASSLHGVLIDAIGGKAPGERADGAY